MANSLRNRMENPDAVRLELRKSFSKFLCLTSGKCVVHKFPLAPHLILPNIYIRVFKYLLVAMYVFISTIYNTNIIQQH